MTSSIVDLLLFLGLAAAVPAAKHQEPTIVRRPVSIPIKVLRYAEHVIERYDTNGDGSLDSIEWGRMQGNPRAADRDRDGVITAEELAEWVARYGHRRKIRLMPATSEGRIRYPTLLSPDVSRSLRRRSRPQQATSGGSDQARSAGASPRTGSDRPKRTVRKKFTVSRSRLPKGLPSWFRTRDRDGDGQVTLAEYAPEASVATVREFACYDTNGDGVITPQECLCATKKTAPRTPGEEQTAEPSGATQEPAMEESPAEDTEPQRARKPPARKKKARGKRLKT